MAMGANPKSCDLPTARQDSALEAILGLPCVIFACREEPTDGVWLLPAEAELAANFAPPRRRDFELGRTCARHALHRFGLAEAVLLPKADRSVAWPTGIVGSITHTSGFCAAAVAPSAEILSVGIDAEQVGRVTADLWRLLFTDNERGRLQNLATIPREAAATVLFAAKEAYFKLQFPVTRSWVDFPDVEGEIGPDWVRLRRRAPLWDGLDEIEGHYCVEQGLAVVALAKHRSQPTPS